MDNQFQKYSVRNLASHTVVKIMELCASTRLPAGAIIEDAVDMLWDSVECDDWNQQIYDADETQ